MMSTIRPGRRRAGAQAAAPASDEERAFLEIGDGAEQWLIKAAAAGAQRCGARWPRRSTSQSSTAPSEVDRALRTCAAGRPVRRR